MHTIANAFNRLCNFSIVNWIEAPNNEFKCFLRFVIVFAPCIGFIFGAGTLLFTFPKVGIAIGGLVVGSLVTWALMPVGFKPDQ